MTMKLPFVLRIELSAQQSDRCFEFCKKWSIRKHSYNERDNVYFSHCYILPQRANDRIESVRIADLFIHSGARTSRNCVFSGRFLANGLQSYFIGRNRRMPNDSSSFWRVFTTEFIREETIENCRNWPKTTRFYTEIDEAVPYLYGSGNGNYGETRLVCLYSFVRYR